MMDNLPDNVFRANVGAIIIDDSGLVLTLERIGVKGAWQMLQGGIDENEEVYHAILREINEEIGLTEKDLFLLKEADKWLAYELPKDKRTAKHGRGQVQKWFLFRLVGNESNINLNVGEREFNQYCWMKMDDLINLTISFRRPVYSALKDMFKDFLA